MTNNTKPYNPFYDPLLDLSPGENTAYAPTYWQATAGEAPTVDEKLTGEHSVDVAIIGGGFTGLATAMFLAKTDGIKASVFEANQLGWGCTSRNGGQAHLAWGRLSRSQWLKKWGETVAKNIHNNTLAGFELFKQLSQDSQIDCQPYGHGNLLVSHSKKAQAQLDQESQLCQQVFGYQTKILSKRMLDDNYLLDCEAHGALLEPVGMAVHPLKLAFGYARVAKQYGANIYTGSPIIAWHRQGDYQYLQTPSAQIKAKIVAIATAGYTSANLHPLVAYRQMPIMANSAVTRVLTDAEINACRFNTFLPITDSRKLRHYYRFLPDKRLQIGTRSAISGKDIQSEKHLNTVRQAIGRKFPVLTGVEIDYFWHGWMDISHDMMPRIVQPDKKQAIFYAQGYSGNGVAFSAYAAKKMADLIAGRENPDKALPIFSSPLPKHPLQPFRRLGQRALYRYYKYLDTIR